MTCANLGIIGTIIDRSQPALVQGGDAFLVVQMTYRGTTTPYGMENFEGASAYFLDSSNAIVNIPASLVSADLGKIRVDLAASATSEIALTDEGTFQVDFEDDRGLTKVLVPGLQVVAPLYPST